MSEITKIQQLELLRNDIEASITNAWLFPAREPVQGFLGTGPIMFVGERPSTGSFMDKQSLLLYSLLEKHGVPNAHLSDVIKTRAKARELYPQDMSPHWHVFNREIEIVQPRVVIAFGQRAYDMLQFSLSGPNIKLQQIYHYSYARRGKDKADALDEQMRLAVATNQPLLIME